MEIIFQTLVAPRIQSYQKLTSPFPLWHGHNMDFQFILQWSSAHTHILFIYPRL
jgi:hypothetical protein